MRLRALSRMVGSTFPNSTEYSFSPENKQQREGVGVSVGWRTFF